MPNFGFLNANFQFHRTHLAFKVPKSGFSIANIECQKVAQALLMLAFRMANRGVKNASD